MTGDADSVPDVMRRAYEVLNDWGEEHGVDEISDKEALRVLYDAGLLATSTDVVGASERDRSPEPRTFANGTSQPGSDGGPGTASPTHDRDEMVAVMFDALQDVYANPPFTQRRIVEELADAVMALLAEHGWQRPLTRDEMVEVLDDKFGWINPDQRKDIARALVAAREDRASYERDEAHWQATIGDAPVEAARTKQEGTDERE
jgi:hypothetical protein